MSEAAPETASSGLRERKKRKKRERILSAARALFLEHGFEGTTTRAISEAAGIGAGTLFTYFRDKRSLLVHLFVDDIEAQVARAAERLDPDAPIVDQVMHMFGACFDFYGQDLELSRTIVKNLLFLDPEDSAHLDGATFGFLQRIAGRIAVAQARGEVRSSVDPLAAATCFFGQYYVALIAWTSGNFGGRETVEALLRGSLELIRDGLVPVANSQEPRDM